MVAKRGGARRGESGKKERIMEVVVNEYRSVQVHITHSHSDERVVVIVVLKQKGREGEGGLVA